MRDTFLRILVDKLVPEKEAAICANTFVDNSLDGVYTHGVNRFPGFVQSIMNGIVNVAAHTVLISQTDSMEVYDGKRGIGIINAIECTHRAIELAKLRGIGCVSVKNTNHWMRAGTYARIGTANGVAFICWTNTVGNMPAWGAIDRRLGNNPIAIGVPFGNNPVILDMAMTQYSIGNLEFHATQGKELSFPGGFNIHGEFSTDPAEILQAGRVMPMGFWKGAGLSLLLDILATIFSGGSSVRDISQEVEETNISQVFIAFDTNQLGHSAMIPQLVNRIIDDYKSSITEDGKTVRYPGERIASTRATNLENGIPVLRSIWTRVKNLEANLSSPP